MRRYQQAFAEAIAQTPGVLLLDRQYLAGGDPSIHLKDGRRALYFLNLGGFSDGESGTIMGEAFAEALEPDQFRFQVVIGPAYKGITIANDAVGALWRQYRIQKDWAYRRKEAKDHGEKGAVVGANLKNIQPPPEGGNIGLWLVDDVISSAATKIEEKRWFEAYADVHDIPLQMYGLTVGIDREQKAVIDDEGAPGGKRQLQVTAARYFSDLTDVDVDVVLPVTELMTHLYESRVENDDGVVIDGDFMRAFELYQKEFGVGE